MSGTETKTGRAAYEASVALKPVHQDGTPRRPWDRLPAAIQRNWCEVAAAKRAEVRT